MLLVWVFQKGLGAIHSLSHPINAQNNIHHGSTAGTGSETGRASVILNEDT